MRAWPAASSLFTDIPRVFLPPLAVAGVLVALLCNWMVSDEDDGVEVEEEESDQETGQPGAAAAAVRQAEAEGLTLQPSDNATGYRGVYKESRPGLPKPLCEVCVRWLLAANLNQLGACPDSPTRAHVANNTPNLLETRKRPGRGTAYTAYRRPTRIACTHAKLQIPPCSPAARASVQPHVPPPTAHGPRARLVECTSDARARQEHIPG